MLRSFVFKSQYQNHPKLEDIHASSMTLHISSSMSFNTVLDTVRNHTYADTAARIISQVFQNGAIFCPCYIALPRAGLE